VPTYRRTYEHNHQSVFQYEKLSFFVKFFVSKKKTHQFFFQDFNLLTTRVYILCSKQDERDVIFFNCAKNRSWRISLL
jgi:hypothetical protein